MRRGFFLGFLVATVNITSVSGQTPCNDININAPGQLRLPVEPFDGVTDIAQIDIEVLPASNASCVAAYSIEPIEGATWTLNGLGGVASPDFRLGEVNFVGNGVFEAPALPSGQTPFTMLIDDNSVLEAGDYQTTVQVTALDEAGEQIAPPILIELFINAIPRAEIYVAGAASSFGNLPAVDTVRLVKDGNTASGRAIVQIRSNSDVLIEVSSENGGKLVHDTAPDLTINYQLSLDGEVVPLASPSQLQKSPERSLAGENLPLDVILTEDLSKKFAGRYRDIVRFEISPQ